MESPGGIAIPWITRNHESNGTKSWKMTDNPRDALASNMEPSSQLERKHHNHFPNHHNEGCCAFL